MLTFVSRALVVVIFARKYMGPRSFCTRHTPRCCQWQLAVSFYRLCDGLDPYGRWVDVDCGLLELGMLVGMLTLAWRAAHRRDVPKRVRKGGGRKVGGRKEGGDRRVTQKVVGVRRATGLSLDNEIEAIIRQARNERAM